MKFQPVRRGLRTGVSAVAVAAVLSLSVMATGALAADTSTLQGRAAPGATVTATDTVTGQSVTTTAGSDGSYIIVGLRPSNYHVVAGANQDDIALAVGETGTLDLADTAATEAQGAVVVRGRRTKEVRTSEIATSVSQRQIENLPQNDRNFLNFAALAPGVSVSTDPFRKTFQAGAVSANNVNVFIDGQSYKGQVQQGGIAGQDSSQGNPFPQLAVQEFKVSTQNFRADQEMSGSAVISAITKTGGAEFHGTAFVQYVPNDWFGIPYFDRKGKANNPNGDRVQPDYERKQYGFDIGGPIIKNRLHFYYAYEGADQLNPGTNVDITDTNVPASIRAENGPYERKFSQGLHFGKLTFFATDADTFNFQIFDRKETRLDDFGGNRTFAGARDVDNKVGNVQLDWKHRGENYLFESSLAWQYYTWDTPLHSPSDRVISVLGDTGGESAILGQSFAQTSSQETYTMKSDLTLTNIDWHGDHVIKMGAKLAANAYDREEGEIIPTYYYFGNFDPMTDLSNPADRVGRNASTYNPGGTNAPARARVALAPTQNIHSSNTQIGLYIQDDWTFDDHWTFNLGVRWDFETNMMNNGYRTPDAVANALRNYTGFKAAGFNPEDYISNGSNRKAFYGAIQPRLGFAYDVHGDRDLVIFGGAGRYYDRTIFNSAQLEERLTINQVKDVLFCGAGTGFDCAPGDGRIQWNATYNDPERLRQLATTIGLGGGQKVLNNDTKVPYTDQINIGIRKRFGDINTSISIANNKSYDGFEYVRGNRYDNGTYTDMGDGFILDNHPSPLPGFGRLEIGTNGKKTRYNALYVTVDKAFTPQSRYGYSGTLTLTDTAAIGMADGDDNYTAARSDAYGYVAAPGVDKMRFVGTAMIAGPWDTLLSTNITLASGKPFGSIDATGPLPAGACCRANFNGVYFPEDKLSFQQVDIRIAKDIELPNGQMITVDGQVYNVFDHVNRAYSAWGAGANWGGGPSLKENATQGVARTFQVGLKYKW